MQKSYSLLIFAQFGLFFSICAQGRANLPIPIIEDTARTELLGTDIVGWTYGDDQRWYSLERGIPIKTTSYEWEQVHERPPYRLGADNIQFLEIIKIRFDTVPYTLFVKGSLDGYYEYPSRLKGWTETEEIQYFLMKDEELEKYHRKDSLGSFFYEIELQDHGILTNIRLKKRKEWLKILQEKVVPRENHPWRLMIHQELYGNENIARFQVYPMHHLFKDVDGLRQVQQIKGKRIYGKPELLQYFYYEVPFDQLYRFLNTDLF